MKKILAFLLAAIMVLATGIPAFAAGEKTETHVVINQVYGASQDGYASHSFIELYNPGDSDVDLTGWSIQYKSSESGDNKTDWKVLELTGKIAAKDYYLIRCGAVSDSKNVKYNVPEGNQEWDIPLHNKGLSVVLMSNSMKLTADFAGDITAEGFAVPEGFVDLAAVQGNDGDEDQIPPAYEKAYAAIQSKKKAIRRVEFADTDDNSADFEEVDYSKDVATDKLPHKSTAASGTDPQPSQPEDPLATYTPAETTNEKYEGYYNKTAGLQAELVARYNSGASNADGGSAEILVYNAKTQFIYVVNGIKGTVDYISMTGFESDDTVQQLAGQELDVKNLIEGKDSDFTYGDLTSVAVSGDGRLLAAAVQDADYTKNGRVVIFTCNTDGTLEFKGMTDTGVQPDMVTFNESSSLILTANEGEPRQGYTAADAVDPMGSVTIVKTADLSAVTVDFLSYDSERSNLVENGIVIKKDTLPSVDFEPEYIAVSGNKAYVSLQENNAIAVLDLETEKYTGVYSVGFEDYSNVEIDLNSGDGTYAPENYENIRGIRMPDGITAYTIGGETYLLTANEGDSRAWPVETEADVNEIKDKTSPVNGIKFDKKVTWFDVSQYDGLEEGMDYIFGARGFSVLKVTDNGLEEVFDSESDFERITWDCIPDNFNCSNDDKTLEDRSGKKGPEPETVTTGKVGTNTYAFIALERIGGIMIYDITDPANSEFVNYINSRDFSEDIVNDVGPEGLYFVGASASPDGKPMLLVANEVSGTVSVVQLNAAGWQLNDGKWYYLKTDGTMATGWLLDGGKWYYLNSAGVMQTGWVSVNGKWYYMNSSGAMVTGWALVNGKWYYMNSSGAMATGWALVNGKWYYMNSSGAMVTGWALVNGKWYYMNSNGAMQTGWIKLNGKWYYLSSSGAMVTGTQKIGNTTYVFSSNGVWIR